MVRVGSRHAASATTCAFYGHDGVDDDDDDVVDELTGSW